MTESAYALDTIVERLDNGRFVKIHAYRPIKLQMYYWTHDLLDGHGTLLAHDQLRPVQAVEPWPGSGTTAPS